MNSLPTSKVGAGTRAGLNPMSRIAFALPLWLWCLLFASNAGAIDFYEIQIYTVETTAAVPSDARTAFQYRYHGDRPACSSDD